jgi:hypothetical protein
MTTQYHAVVWFHQREAKIFHLDATRVERTVLHPHGPANHLRFRSNPTGSGEASPDETHS